MSVPDLIPVNVLTGFLGSGKTTLLRRLLRSPTMADTAVLINEFGEVALDHLLIGRIDASTVVLESGCICCTIRSDVSAALRELYDKAERGLCRKFDRTVIETTGLADPAPIIHTLMTDPVIRHHFRLSSVIATVDAVNAARHLADNPESVKQAAVADRLVLTKTDLATPEAIGTMRRRLAALNPSAQVVDANQDPLGPELLLAPTSMTRAVGRPRRASGSARRGWRIPISIASSAGTPPTSQASISCSSIRSIGPASASGWPCCSTGMANGCSASRASLTSSARRRPFASTESSISCIRHSISSNGPLRIDDRGWSSSCAAWILPLSSARCSRSAGFPRQRTRPAPRQCDEGCAMRDVR